MDLVWCEVDTAALRRNMGSFKGLLKPGVRLAPAVKSNAYGHGLVLAASAFLAGGADWLCVNALYEVEALRQAGFTCPLYVMGYLSLEQLERAVELDARMVVYNQETVDALVKLVKRLGKPAYVHIKVETGNNRQGVGLEEALKLADRCRAQGVTLEGLATHFANVEDTTDHRFAEEQLERFERGVRALRGAGHELPICHTANSAATLLWPHAQFDLVRVGISSYGLWPSRETLLSATLEGRGRTSLTQALTWKTRIAQIKRVGVGEFVGYGCTFMATHPTRLAILPVGYYDGYDRGLSNLAYVLIRGQRAPVRGRVCMNIIMVDVTDIPEARVEDEVVLLGGQGGQYLSAEQLGEWSGTINYEVVARIADHVPRIARG
ncbi:MAG: alanine racemase [Myxococcota bacterium]